jgi:hypothetical protein
MGQESSLPSAQQLAIGSYLDPATSSPHVAILFHKDPF